MRAGLDWHSLGDEAEGFWLRILGPGDYRYHGADLGMLITRTRMQDDDGALTDAAQAWIAAIRGQLRRHAAARRSAAAGLRRARRASQGRKPR